MKQIGQSVGSFVGGIFLLGWAYYEFTRPYGDLWLGKITGGVAALGAIMIAVSVWLPFRRKKSGQNSKPPTT
jgi:hypothetical protein